MITEQQIAELTVGQKLTDTVNGATITVQFDGFTNTSSKRVYRTMINRENPIFKGGYDSYSAKAAHKVYRSFVKQAKEAR